MLFSDQMNDDNNYIKGRELTFVTGAVAGRFIFRIRDGA